MIIVDNIEKIKSALAVLGQEDKLIRMDFDSKFPTEQGLYFVVDNEELILYLGMTENLRKRWQQHHKFEACQENGARFLYFWKQQLENMHIMEAWFLSTTKTLLNKAGVTCKKEPRRITVLASSNEKELETSTSFATAKIKNYQDQVASDILANPQRRYLVWTIAKYGYCSNTVSFDRVLKTSLIDLAKDLIDAGFVNKKNQSKLPDLSMARKAERTCSSSSRSDKQNANQFKWVLRTVFYFLKYIGLKRATRVFEGDLHDPGVYNRKKLYSLVPEAIFNNHEKVICQRGLYGRRNIQNQKSFEELILQNKEVNYIDFQKAEGFALVNKIVDSVRPLFPEPTKVRKISRCPEFDFAEDNVARLIFACHNFGIKIFRHKDFMHKLRVGAPEFYYDDTEEAYQQREADPYLCSWHI